MNNKLKPRTMEKMKPLLINEGTDRANQEIQDHKQRARIMTELIQHYNKLPHLSDIEDAIEAREFLADPRTYLNEAIFNELGVTWSGKVKPVPEAVATMYGIPYGAIFQRIVGALPHLKHLSRFGFDENVGQIYLLPEGEDVIREECRQYLKSEEDIIQYNKLKGVCDQLNELCKEYKLTGMDINTAARTFSFMVAVPGKPGEGWMLAPNVNLIRHKNGQSIL